MPLSKSVVARLQYQHESIGELVAGLNQDQLKYQVLPGKWSAFENIAHLGSYQPTFIQRMALILDEKSPLFERYIAEKDPLFYTYLEKSLTGLLADIRAKREIIVSELMNLKEQQLNLTGTHPKFGTFSLAKWTDLFLLHEGHHLWTLFQLTCALRAVPAQ